jgi:hypothetical protein
VLALNLSFITSSITVVFSISMSVLITSKIQSEAVKSESGRTPEVKSLAKNLVSTENDLINPKPGMFMLYQNEPAQRKRTQEMSGDENQLRARAKLH